MAIQYLSEAWAEQALRRVETDARIRKALAGIELSLLVIVLHPPKACYGFLYTAFDRRGLSDYRVGYDYHAVAKGLAPPTFVVSGHYDVFAAIQRRELSERRALVMGKLHLTGSMVKALRHMRALETITEVLTAIPCKT
ncbi:MAG TPA: SCP2 sterol-binding domain-containing protein [Candidatus Thermoplasmatota archaeon]|nr:SCP2 sterol-binding domain-containing protein [Candidatus Thermoplasmatota archaeon]